MGFLKRKKAAQAQAQAKLDNLTNAPSRFTKTPKRSYQTMCGHCKGSRVMSNGKPCRNCGGSGKITRYA